MALHLIQRLKGPATRGSLGHQGGGEKRASPQHSGHGLPGQCPRRWLPVGERSQIRLETRIRKSSYPDAPTSVCSP